MEKSLFVIGWLSFNWHKSIYWKFDSFWGTEKELIERIEKRLLSMRDIEYSLYYSRENVFICEYHKDKGKILRDDLLGAFKQSVAPPFSDFYLVDMDLSVRALNALKSIGIISMEQLIQHCVNEDKTVFIPLKKVKNVGKTTNDELRKFLMLCRAMKACWPDREIFI
jgi:hypothetical protein